MYLAKHFHILSRPNKSSLTDHESLLSASKNSALGAILQLNRDSLWPSRLFREQQPCVHSMGILSRSPYYKSVLAMCTHIFCTSRRRTRDFRGRPLSGRFLCCDHSPTPPSTLALRLANRLHLLRLLSRSTMGIHFYNLLFGHK